MSRQPKKTIDLTGETFDAIDTVGGVDINTVTPTLLSFDTIRETNALLYNQTSPTQVTVLSSGVYYVSFKVYGVRVSGGSKNIACIIRVNGVIVSETTTIHAGEGNNSAPNLTWDLTPKRLSLTANDVLEVISLRLSGNGGVVNSQANSSCFSIKKYV